MHKSKSKDIILKNKKILKKLNNDQKLYIPELPLNEF